MCNTLHSPFRTRSYQLGQGSYKKLTLENPFNLNSTMSRRPYFIAGLDLYRQGGNFLYSLHSPWVIYENVARKNIIGNSFTYQTSKKKSYFFSSRRESLLDVIQNKIDSWNWKKRERERNQIVNWNSWFMAVDKSWIGFFVQRWWRNFRFRIANSRALFPVVNSNWQ